MSNVFRLEHPQLTYCHGFWNPETKTYDKGTSLDVINCCIDGCKDYVHYCFDHNKGEKCHELVNNCLNVCADYPSEEVKKIDECAAKYNCGSFPFTTKSNQECLRKHEKEIEECSQYKIPGKSLRQISLLKRKREKEKENYMLYIVFFLFVILSIIGIYILV